MEPFSSRHLHYNALKLWAKLTFSLMQGNLVEKDQGAPITEPLLNLILLAPNQVPTVAWLVDRNVADVAQDESVDVIAVVVCFSPVILAHIT
jgi:hypothetical protein